MVLFKIPCERTSQWPGSFREEYVRLLWWHWWDTPRKKWLLKIRR